MPLAITATQTASARSICKWAVNCFGFPHLDGVALHGLVKSLLPDDLNRSWSTVVAETLAATGAAATAGSGGFPALLLTGAMNVPIVIPSTARMLLRLATDVILILARAFRESLDKGLDRPDMASIRRVGLAYQSLSKEVHADVADLISRWNVTKSYQKERIGLGFEQVVKKYKKQFVDGFDSGQKVGLASTMTLNTMSDKSSTAATIDSLGGLTLRDSSTTSL